MSEHVTDEGFAADETDAEAPDFTGQPPAEYKPIVTRLPEALEEERLAREAAEQAPPSPPAADADEPDGT